MYVCFVLNFVKYAHDEEQIKIREFWKQMIERQLKKTEIVYQPLKIAEQSKNIAHYKGAGWRSGNVADFGTGLRAPQSNAADSNPDSPLK